MPLVLRNSPQTLAARHPRLIVFCFTGLGRLTALAWRAAQSTSPASNKEILDSSRSAM